MASLIKCDKCGMVSTNYSKYRHIRCHELTSIENYRTNAINHIDVCNECYKKIFKEDNK